jgi:O-6-methylguanine DNA methyltransferase
MHYLIHSAVIRHDRTTVIIRGIEKGGRLFLTGLLLGSKAEKTASKLKNSPVHPLLMPVIAHIMEYLNGTPIDLGRVRVELENVSEFQKAVLLAARRIPYGKTVSYASLAEMAGYPRAIRAVGSVMRKNPLALVIPCHRVIRSDGSSGAYCGDSKGEDAGLKRTLLQLEKDAQNKKHHPT